ncbi:GerMN domain-containing protein [Merismopedia glauca]|uniref:Spore germination protein n=1 Tax=Merismopedia glauca CCAP 1448/3 TaxID=1296344 RepID=A0A2T1BYB5_9CYAN|nr:GerMN domain-containing protein [Merismopedia glauca]PSB00917.1 spore germination protein [Merismopedia glauca CCAP 1448/3]
MSEPGNRRFPVIIAAIFSTLLVGGGGLAWWISQNNQGLKPISPPTTQSQLVPGSATPSVQSATEKSLNLYWLKDNGKKLELVPSPVQVQAGDNPSTVLQAVFRALLAGSNNSQLASTIPQGTKLRSLEVKPDGVHVNLSQEFTSGGGSASMSGRLGQVVYTATALDPNASVWINVEGKKLEVLGGEGLEIEQPLTRQKFREDFDF